MRAIRGAVVWPLSPSEVHGSADAVVEPGLAAPRAPVRGDPDPVDGVLVPAFADWHFHWVQLGMPAAAGRPLLEWLAQVAWPTEERFADPRAARDAAPRAVSALRAAGTLAGAAYGSPHDATVRAFLDAAPGGFVCGAAVMTAGPPASLRRPPEDALDEIAASADVHGRRVVVTPRFAISCGEPTLAALGTLAARRDLVVQTHLAETERECEVVASRFPDAPDYTSVYERAGLVGPRTLLGHVIHVSDDELDRIARRSAIAVHCPTSNVALGSGRMPLERLRRAGVRWVLGSDVGAASEPCLLDVIAAALEIHRGHAELTAVEAFHRATIGRFALLQGASEGRLSRLGDRPGVLRVRDHDGPRPEQDPEGWLRAWVARWGAEGDPGLHAVLPWSALPGAGSGGIG